MNIIKIKKIGDTKATIETVNRDMDGNETPKYLEKAVQQIKYCFREKKWDNEKKVWTVALGQAPTTIEKFIGYTERYFDIETN